MYNLLILVFVFMPFSDRRPFTGDGSIIGSDEEGDSDSVKTPLDTIKKDIFYRKGKNEVS
jgi:hypothetical protein